MIFPGDVAQFSLVFVRVATLALLLPNVAHVFPVRWRMAVAIVLTALIAPLLAATPLEVSDAARYVELFFEQVFWGAFLGGVLRLFLTTFAMAGVWVSHIAGWGTDETTTGGEPSLPALGQLHAWLGGMAFLAMGGIPLTIDAIWNLFAAVPIGSGIADFSALIEHAGAALVQAFWLSLQVGSPVIASLLISTMAVGAIQRAMPHVQLVRFQIAGNWLVLLVALSMTIGLNMDYWRQNIAGVLRSIPGVAHEMQSATTTETENVSTISG